MFDLFVNLAFSDLEFVVFLTNGGFVLAMFVVD